MSMLRHSRLRWLALGAVVSLSCTESTGPKNCTGDTGVITATVTTGATVTFDWEPRCAVALLLVEEEASDQWAITAPDFNETATSAANVILPPVTYGQVPAGAEEFQAPQTLVAGTTYELVLWRIVEEGTSPACQERFENACLVAVKTFQR
jgi:hypothetical protein